MKIRALSDSSPFRVVSSVYLVIVAQLLTFSIGSAATLNPEFTYQGHLGEGEDVATGEYEFLFTLYNTDASETIVAGPITNAPVTVAEGYFTTVLNFETNVFNGARRWLEIGVRTNGALEDFTILLPRQSVSPTPYALFADTAESISGPIDADRIQSGTLSSGRLGTNIARLNLNQSFTAPNTFESGVVVTAADQRVPFQVIGNDRIPHLRLSAESNSVNGTALSLDAGGMAGGSEYLLSVLGEESDEDTGKLRISDASRGYRFMTFSTNGFVGVNESAPASRLDVNGTVSANNFVGSGSGLTGLDAGELNQLSVNALLVSNKVARLDRGQTFIGAQNIEGFLSIGTTNSENIFIGSAPPNLDRGLLRVMDEDGSKALELVSSANGGQLLVGNADGVTLASVVASGNGSGAIGIFGANGELNFATTTASSADYGGLGTYGPDGIATTTLFSSPDGGVLTLMDSSGSSKASMVAGPDGAAFLVLNGKNGDPNFKLSYLATNRANYGVMSIYNNNNEAKVIAYADDDEVGKVLTYGPSGALNTALGFGTDEDYGGIYTLNESGDSLAVMYGGDDGGQIEVNNQSGELKARMFVSANDEGWVITDVLRITGGADIAEPFDIHNHDSGQIEDIEPGMVVAIDPANAGELCLSTKPYDRTVAGIISGAGGVQPGLTLQQEGTLADGRHPVALTGRVWCYVDADEGAVVPGDLLTTSGTPGHAMKVTDYQRAQGAVVGKAMTSLSDGSGLVLVLVSLQ